MFRFIPRKKGEGEKGQALILVLVLLTLVCLIIPPLLGFMGTGSKSGAVYQEKTSELYAADAGIQDATWLIKYNHFSELGGYSPYLFGTPWNYATPPVNNQSVNVTIQNEWIPSYLSPGNLIPAPDAITAEAIITDARVVVTGSTIGTGITLIDGTMISQYQIKITYYPNAGETFRVSGIGVWLPPGCSYYSDGTYKSYFEDPLQPADCLTEPEDPILWKGSESIIWCFDLNPKFEDFLNVTGELPIELEATFYFKPPQTQIALKPQIVSWIVPSGLAGIPVSWDADNRIFKLLSTSGSTTVESYLGKSELRQMSAAMGGDYFAIGNSNLYASGGSKSRTNWNDPSSASVDNTDIPSNARVTKAFLYWSGWRPDDEVTSIFSDNCNDFTNWAAGSSWSLSSPAGHFRGTDITGLELTKITGLDLRPYNSSLVIISWEQSVSSGGTQNQKRVPNTDGDTGGTWTTAPYWDDVDETAPDDNDYITGTATGGGSQTQTRVPTSDGDTSGTWNTSPCWDDVDETTPNDATDFMTGTTAGHKLFSFSPFSIPTEATITNLTVYIRARDTSSGDSNTRQSIKVGGTIYDDIATPYVDPDTSWNGNTDSYSFTNNPQTGLAWTVADLNGTGPNPLEQFGVYTDGSPDTEVTMVYAEVNYVINACQLFNFSAFSIPDGSIISNLTVYIRARDASSGTNNIYERIKVNGVYYNGSSSHNPGTSFTPYNYSWDTNPSTGLAWTVEDINGTGSNPLQQIGVYSTDLDPDMRVSMVYAQVNYTSPITSADGIDFAFYTDDAGWSAPIQAFRGNIGSWDDFSYTIPEIYLDENFKIKFTVVGFNGTGNYANLDNISITAMEPDYDVVFKIDDGSGATQVYLDAGIDGVVGTDDDEPRDGAQKLTASKCQVVQNFANGTDPHGFSYSSHRDVTALVQEYSQSPTTPPTNYPGYGTYLVGDIHSTPSFGEEWAYACWSLVIVYESSDTLGHQLYLYDTFTYSNQDTDDGVNVDFDHDGQPGGTISGFIVPPRIMGAVTGISVTNQGSGYTSTPAVNITGGGGEGAAAMAIISSGHVSSISIISGGAGYTSTPTVTITGGEGSGATASATFGDEVNLGKITCFAGEGDVWYDGDYLILNGTKLWDGTDTDDNSKSNPDNAFNSTSRGLGTYNGIDIDTFGIDPPNGQYITWDSGLLNQGDASASIELWTHTDVWNLVYIIISFRSTTTTGGALNYLIH